MIDKQFEWNIDGVQANTVLEGAEVNIPIEKYLYSYNQFIWSDAESHRFFPKYVSMMQKLYKGIDLEIEIL